MTTQITIGNIIATKAVEAVRFDARNLARADELDAGNTPWNEDTDALAHQHRQIANSAFQFGEVVGRLRLRLDQVSSFDIDNATPEEATAWIQEERATLHRNWDQIDPNADDDMYQRRDAALHDIERLVGIIIAQDK